jgi:thiamine-phosphate pyrophosphorylase
MCSTETGTAHALIVSKEKIGFVFSNNKLASFCKFMLKIPRLYPILDTVTLAARACPPLEAAEAFLESGAQILQLRHKDPWTAETFTLAQQITRLCHEANVPFIVNDRADYAHLLNAGLHLGQEDLLPADARTVVGPHATLGYSTHNPIQLKAARDYPVDYLAFGPLYPTASKQNPDPQVGLRGLTEIRALTAKPLVAIGGITRDNAIFCWGAGADSVAVIADLLPQPTNRRTIRERMAEWIRLSAHV